MTEEKVGVVDILTEADGLVGDVLALIERITDGAPLVAIAALERAAGVIQRATEHALDHSYEEVEEFRREAAVVKALAALPPSTPAIEKSKPQ